MNSEHRPFYWFDRLIVPLLGALAALHALTAARMGDATAARATWILALAPPADVPQRLGRADVEDRDPMRLGVGHVKGAAVRGDGETALGSADSFGTRCLRVSSHEILDVEPRAVSRFLAGDEARQKQCDGPSGRRGWMSNDGRWVVSAGDDASIFRCMNSR